MVAAVVKGCLRMGCGVCTYRVSAVKQKCGHAYVQVQSAPQTRTSHLSFSSQTDDTAKRSRDTAHIDFSDASPTDPGTGTGTGSSRNKRSKYLCPICKENAVEPCAATCGHVSCRKCWSHWLAVGKTCPQCKQIVDKDALTAIVVYM